MTDAQAAKLTVGIANYNGRHLLEPLLVSLRAQSFADFRVVVVDDCSSDDSVAWLRERWGDVEVIVHEHNRGVTAALNTCLRASDSPFVALLNNDVELEPDCIGELVAALESHPEAGSACAKLVDSTRRELLDGAGDLYTWGGEANRRGQGEVDRGQYDAPEEVFSACGATAVYRRATLEEVGLFDERFFANYEDVDWGFRAQLLGYTCRYVPSAVSYHVGSATIDGGASDFSLLHNWRNAIWVIAKDYPAGALARHAPELLFVQLRNLAIAARRRRTAVWLRAWGQALAGMPAMLVERRRIQRSRRRTTAELGKVIG